MSRLFHWNQMYSVKVAGMDSQHRRLFSLADRLHEALGSGQAKDVVDVVLEQLVNYTMTHFAAEEALLRKNTYPELMAHLAEHQALRAKVVAFQQQYVAGNNDVPHALMTFLVDWLKNHILKTDRRYTSFLNGKGVH